MEENSKHNNSGVEEFSIEVIGLLVLGKGLLLHEEAPMYKTQIKVSCLLTMKSKASRWGHSQNKGLMRLRGAKSEHPPIL